MKDEIMKKKIHDIYFNTCIKRCTETSNLVNFLLHMLGALLSSHSKYGVRMHGTTFTNRIYVACDQWSLALSDRTLFHHSNSISKRVDETAMFQLLWIHHCNMYLTSRFVGQYIIAWILFGMWFRSPHRKRSYWYIAMLCNITI